MPKETVITQSSGNVFKDLGFSNEEAELLRLRSSLMAHMRQTIEQNQWTQNTAAEILGISQARVSDLVRGKWERFSIDMLITLLIRSGQKCELAIH